MENKRNHNSQRDHTEDRTQQTDFTEGIIGCIPRQIATHWGIAGISFKLVTSRNLQVRGTARQPLMRMRDQPDVDFGGCHEGGRKSCESGRISECYWSRALRLCCGRSRE